jgi:hypothetical protein
LTIIPHFIEYFNAYIQNVAAMAIKNIAPGLGAERRIL